MKKYILGLILCLGCIFNFTNAGYVFKFNQTYAGPFDTNYDINVFGKGIPLTSSLGYSKKMLYITNGRYMFWNENQLPYIYSNGIYGQINFYKVCPNLGGNGNPFGTTSCSSYPCSVSYGQNGCSQTNFTNVEETKNTIGNFFNTLNQTNDYYYIHYVNNLTMFCFYSSSLDKIICFFQPSSSNGTNYGSTFDGVSSNLLFNPPSYSPTGGGNEGEEQQPTTNSNNYYCPTIKQVMANMGANYNTGLCYNSTLKYDNGQITTVEKKDIFTVFENYTEYVNRIDIYNNQCRAPNTTENCQNAFSGQFEKYSIIANAINSNVYPKKLWNYCNMGLNYDMNATTCVASGYIQEQPTEQEFINDIINGQYTKITNINTPNTGDTGNVMNAMLLSGQTRDDIATRDILGQVEQIKDKLQTLFIRRNGINGIIPDYILYIILMTLLLTVLLKK